MCRKSFFLLVKIVLVDLVACEVQASVPGGDPAGSAPKVGVQDSVTRFGVVLEYPGIEGNGLLRGVKSVFFVFHIALKHSVPQIAEHPGNALICPSKFAVRKIIAHFVVASLVPHNKRL